MKIIKPIQIQAASLTSNMVNEAYPGWSQQQWPENSKVIVGNDIWQANIATTKQPAITNNDWTRLGSVNRWRMFDGTVGSESSGNRPFFSGNGQGIQVQLTPSSVVNGLALFNVFADSVRIEVIDSNDGVVYDKTYSLLDNSGVYDWYSYFFQPIKRKRDLVVLDLPNYGGSAIRISIAKQGASARCGMLVMGFQHQIGDTLFGMNPGIKDFSTADTNEFGETKFVRRKSAKRLRAPVMVPSSKADYVYNLLDELRSTPVVWIGTERRECSLIYGFYRSLDVAQSNAKFDDLTINIEGLI
ncbi:hypothetical protein CHH28_03850 [Bacterioplanes sanyensis]|uniref:Chitin-binding type-3 domain-containing protein n=1 Tax=Bacterioplanes sanyensis TaxID=1249553 RepID=A0A222FGJ2_9GAMM|nr:hypothetical protein [Bacterioplanes sanyensis]ASP37859.1 hypothetical protein CHH28_03850 [Bacterioplanes sanyensis]